MPFFGACLGVQLLASALGAHVYPGPVPEVGVHDVHLTPEGRADPLFAHLPDTLPALQWHSDTFDLPDGAVRLLTSPAYENQAFRWGDVAYGVQFHLEVDEKLGTEWKSVPAYEHAADLALGPGGLDRVMTDFRTHAEEMQDNAAHPDQRLARPGRAAARDAADRRGPRLLPVTGPLPAPTSRRRTTTGTSRTTCRARLHVRLGDARRGVDHRVRAAVRPAAVPHRSGGGGGHASTAA